MKSAARLVHHLLTCGDATYEELCAIAYFLDQTTAECKLLEHEQERLAQQKLRAATTIEELIAICETASPYNTTWTEARERLERALLEQVRSATTVVEARRIFGLANKSYIALNEARKYGNYLSVALEIARKHWAMLALQHIKNATSVRAVLEIYELSPWSKKAKEVGCSYCGTWLKEWGYDGGLEIDEKFNELLREAGF